MTFSFTERAAREILRVVRLASRRSERAESLAKQAMRRSAQEPRIEFAMLDEQLVKGGQAAAKLCVWNGTEYAVDDRLEITVEDVHDWASGEVGEILPVMESAKRERFEVPIPVTSPEIGGVALATTAGAIGAASSGQVVSGSVGIHFWEGSSPATIDTLVSSGGGGDLTVTAWNPHNVAIPDATLVIIGQTSSGWLIISAVNYCPA